MSRRLLFLLLSAVGCVAGGQAHADTLISTTGNVVGAVGLFQEPTFGQTFARSWTLSGTFYDVSINATVGGLHGSSTFSGTAYLTNQVGPGATAANEIAETTFTSTDVFTDTNLFSGLTLPPGTYYLVLHSVDQTFWDYTNSPTAAVNPGITTLAPGVSDNGIYFSGDVNAFPPSDSFVADSRNLLFSVSGLSPSEVPEPATWLGATIVGAFLLSKAWRGGKNGGKMQGGRWKMEVR